MVLRSVVSLCFFFFKQKTAYEMRISDWSSDVCSSDLALPPECAEGNCVSAQITRDMATLRDRHAARIDRLKALVFLIHFVGDLHQPLHAGEKGDAGGNKVNAAYGIYAPPRLNLHSVWDGLLAERAISTPPSIVRSEGH